MNKPEIKSIIFSSITALLLLSGCGGGDSADTTAPKFSATILNASVAEGTKDILTLQAEDKSKLTYAITGGADAALFNINVQSGALTLKKALDFFQDKSADGDKIFEVVVTATDEAGNSASQTLYVKLTTSDTQPPLFTSATKVEISKSQKEVMTIVAQDQNGPITYNIANGKDGTLFTIDTNGILSFKELPPYTKEGNNTYEVIVEASDSVENSAKTSITVTVVDKKVVLTTGIPGEAGVSRDWQRTPREGEHAIVALEGNTLMWEDDIEIQSSNGHYRHKTFAGAKTYCENLILSGYDDWRLPTPNELHQLVNHSLVGDPNKYMDDAFKYFNLTYYWTSVEAANGTARVVNIVLGNDDELPQGEDDGNNVRCVRGELSEGEFIVDNTNHTVTDLSTGLVWDNSSNIGTDAQKFNHAGAIAACTAKGMRLPTINELITLADYENKTIRIPDPAGADTLYFWASTPALYENKKYRYFSFDKAANEFGSKTLDDHHEIYIRCVKSK